MKRRSNYIARKTPLKRSNVRLQRKAIRQHSAKRVRENLIYGERRKWFLSQPENLICPVMQAIYDEQRQTSQIHHRKGRGKYFLAEEFWLAVSFEGHAFIHANPALSYERGWMIRK